MNTQKPHEQSMKPGGQKTKPGGQNTKLEDKAKVTWQTYRSYNELTICQIWTRTQFRWLRSVLSRYELAKGNNQTRQLWPILYEEFFQLYPMREDELKELRDECAEENAEAASDGKKSAVVAKRTAAKMAAWPTFPDEAALGIANPRLDLQRLKHQSRGSRTCGCCCSQCPCPSSLPNHDTCLFQDVLPRACQTEGHCRASKEPRCCGGIHHESCPQGVIRR